MENNEDIFKANGYHSEAYHALNHSYQEKMTDLFSRRQINYPMKQLEFEVDTVKITSTMSQQQYLKLQGFVEAFPQKQRNGTTPVVGKDDYQSIILYDDYQLFDATQYVVRNPLGFGYTVSKYFSLSSKPALGSPHHDLTVTLSIQPNRFLNLMAEPLITLLVERVLPIMVHPQVSQLDLTLDMPLIMNNFRVQMGGEAGTKQQVIQELNAHQEYELSRITYTNPEQTRELAVYDKYQALLDNQLIVADTNYISAREAEYYQTHAEDQQFLTRILLSVRTPAAIMRYMKSHEWLMRDVAIDYRDNSGISEFEGTDYATNGKDFRRSFNRMLTYRLREVQQRLQALPYLTDEIWRNTLS